MLEKTMSDRNEGDYIPNTLKLGGTWTPPGAR